LSGAVCSKNKSDSKFILFFKTKTKTFFLLLFQVSDRRLPEPFKICRKSSQKKAAAAPVARLQFASSFSFLCHFFAVAAVLFGPSCRGPAVTGEAASMWHHHNQTMYSGENMHGPRRHGF
jgi:hypothetical protein